MFHLLKQWIISKEIGLSPHFVIRHSLNMNFKENPPELYTLNGHVSFPAFQISNCQHYNTIMSVNVSLITQIYLKLGLKLWITFAELKSGMFSILCTKWIENCEAMTITNSLICIFISMFRKLFCENLWNFQNFITSLWFLEFLSYFHQCVRIFPLFF